MPRQIHLEGSHEVTTTRSNIWKNIYTVKEPPQILYKLSLLMHWLLSRSKCNKYFTCKALLWAVAHERSVETRSSPIEILYLGIKDIGTLEKLTYSGLLETGEDLPEWLITKVNWKTTTGKLRRTGTKLGRGWVGGNPTDPDSWNWIWTCSLFSLLFFCCWDFWLVRKTKDEFSLEVG